MGTEWPTYSDHLSMDMALSPKHHLGLRSQHCRKAGDRHDYICSGYNRHLGLRSQHCRKTEDRYDYICSGYNRLFKYKVEGNMNGIFLIPPPVDNQLDFKVICELNATRTGHSRLQPCASLLELLIYGQANNMSSSGIKSLLLELFEVLQIGWITQSVESLLMTESSRRIT